MKITNPKDLTISPSCDYLQKTIAVVFKTMNDTKKETLGLFVPRLMMGLDATGGPKEQSMTIDYSIIKNSRNKQIGSSGVAWQNWVEVPCQPISGLSSPQYVKGEFVDVGFEDQDIRSLYFYPNALSDFKKRQLDAMDLWVSARATDQDEITEDNTYRFRLDSIHKKIQLVSSQANGEPFFYTLTFDLDKGLFYVGDGKRHFGIDSSNDVIEMVNEAGSIITMKEGTVDFICENLNFKVSKKITINADSVEETYNTVKTEIDTSLEEKIEKHTISGTKRVDEVETIEASGQNMKRKYDMDIVDSSVVNLHGLLGAKQIGWGVPDGGAITPASANIQDSGAANFANPAPMGKSLALAQPTIQILNFMASQLDMVFGMHGVPPAAGAMVASSSALIASPFVKG